MNGVWPEVSGMPFMGRGRRRVMTCQVGQAKVSHLAATTQSLSWALRRCAGPCSLAQVRAGMPGPRSLLGCE